MKDVIAYDDLTSDEVAKIARENHIWVNALNCINPSDKFKQEVGDLILYKLDKTNLRATKLLNGKQPVGNMIVLTINKS